MPWAIRLRGQTTSEVCCSYGKHRGTLVVRAGFEPAMPNNGFAHSLPGIEPAPPPDYFCTPNENRTRLSSVKGMRPNR
jgi:hypothetical protein